MVSLKLLRVNVFKEFPKRQAVANGFNPITKFYYKYMIFHSTL